MTFTLSYTHRQYDITALDKTRLQSTNELNAKSVDDALQEVKKLKKSPDWHNRDIRDLSLTITDL
jgi:hypothetical protein